MTLTRELRTGAAFIVAVFLVLTAFVWGNQRLVHAANVVDIGQILCYVDASGNALDGNTGTFPVFRLNGCGNSSLITDWCPNIPGDQAEDKFPQCDAGNGGGGGGDGGDSSSDLSIQKTVSNASPAPSSTIAYTVAVHNAGPDAAQNVSVTDALPAGVAYVSDDSSGAYDHATGVWAIGALASDATTTLVITVTDEAVSGIVVTNTASITHSDSSDSNGGNNSAEASFTSTADAQGGGGGNPQCSDGIDNDNDGKIDFPADASCTDANDDSEADPSSGGNNSSGGGGGHHHRSSGGSVNNDNQGEVLGAETECPMYLTGYIKYGANNDAGEVAKLQAFLNMYEGNALAVNGTYDRATLAAVNSFQRKYSSDVLEPWGLKGVTGYVYYTTQKQVNTIYCKFQKDFPLSAGQIEEIAYVRAIQPQLHAQRAAGMGTAHKASAAASAAKPAAVPAVGSVVLPGAQSDENATRANTASRTATTAAGAATTTASSTPGWFGKFINWLFGR